MSEPIWNTKDIKDTGIRAVKEFIGTMVGLPKFGKWENSNTDYAEFNFEDVEIIESDVPVILKDDKFNFRLNYTEGKNSVWERFVLKPYEELGVELPSGLDGLRVHYKMTSIDCGKVKAGAKLLPGQKVGDDIKSTHFKPIEIVGGANSPKDYSAMAMALANGKTEAQFKTAILTDATLRKVPEIKEGVKDGSLVKGWVKAKLVTVDAKGIITVK